MSKRKKNRREIRQAKYEPRVTPTHHVRLIRIPVSIDLDRRWYVIRTKAAREREVQRDLERAGFVTCRPIDVSLTIRRGRSVEVQGRPAAGYLFVAVDAGVDGREALWRYHDTVVASTPSLSVLDRHGREIRYEGGPGRERPFYRVYGPLSELRAQEMKDFVGRLAPAPMAVLYEGDEPIVIFPGTAFGLADHEQGLFVDVLCSRAA